MTITLSTLRQRTLERSDMVNSNFVSTEELNSYINNSASELYDLLVSRFEDYYTTYFLFTIVSPNDGYTLPTSFFKLRGLDFQISGDYVTIHPFTFEDRNRGNRQINRALLGLTNIKYRLIGNQVKIIPQDQAAGNYRCWYIPEYQDMVLDNDTSNVLELENWWEYIIVDAAIKCMQKEESDVSVLMAQKQMLIQRLNSIASNRDAGSPQTIQDVRDNIWDDPLVRF